MDFNTAVLLAAMWFIVSLIRRGERNSKAPPRPPVRPPVRAQDERSAPDATQREGRRLELVLRELQRSLEARAEEVEERESSEAEAEVASVEGEVRRESRPTVDQDDEAEGIEARRIKAAADRDAPRVKTDHVEFDRRIRQEAADHTATRAYTPQQLRNAIIWREILGPPVALRGER